MGQKCILIMACFEFIVALPITACSSDLLDPCEGKEMTGGMEWQVSFSDVAWY